MTNSSGTKHKKQGPSSNVDYAEAARRLRTLRTLPFKTRKNFKPWQKAYITRQYREHRNAYRAVQRGDAKTIRTTEYRARAFSKQYHKVGNTIIVPKVDKARIVKREGKLTLRVKSQGAMRDFYPLSTWSQYNEIHSAVERLRKKYNKPEFQLTIGENASTQAYSYKQFMQYLSSLAAAGVMTEKPFSGIIVTEGEPD